MDKEFLKLWAFWAATIAASITSAFLSIAFLVWLFGPWSPAVVIILCFVFGISYVITEEHMKIKKWDGKR